MVATHCVWTAICCTRTVDRETKTDILILFSSYSLFFTYSHMILSSSSHIIVFLRFHIVMISTCLGGSMLVSLLELGCLTLCGAGSPSACPHAGVQSGWQQPQTHLKYCLLCAPIARLWPQDSPRSKSGPHTIVNGGKSKR